VRIRILTYLTATAMAGSIAFYATHGGATSTTHIVHASYTTTDVLEFILLSRGRVVADHPALDTAGSMAAPNPPAPDVRAALESLSGCIQRIDASAGPALTAAFNAADPQRLDSALRRFDAAAGQWLTAPYKQDPCPPPPPPPSAPPQDGAGSGWWHVKGWGFINYVGIINYIALGEDFYVGYLTVGVVGAISLGIFVAALVAVWAFVVPILISYEFENAPTDLDRQTAIAKIARTLRS
jgi:hypothetical protein